jgi:hypothetical protein
MNSSVSVKSLILLISLVIFFHLAIVFQFIPYTIAWGGRINSLQEMYVFEFFSIVINLFLIAVLMMRGNYIKHFFSQKIVTRILWMYFVIFSLNTLGNLFAKTNLEKSFSVLTLLFAVLLFIILNNKNFNKDKM